MLLIVFIGLFHHGLSSIILFCRYWMVFRQNIGVQKYSCEANFTVIGDGRNIVELQGNHWGGRNDTDVQDLDVSRFNPQVSFIPQNIGRFFPNLETMLWRNSQLNELNFTDFQQFPNLEILEMSGNTMASLPADLFIHNQRLRSIFFTFNFNLESIGRNLLFFPQNLTNVEFTSNSLCSNEIARSRVDVLVLNTRIHNICHPRETTTNTWPSPTTTPLPDQCSVVCQTQINQLMNENENLRIRLNEIERIACQSLGIIC